MTPPPDENGLPQDIGADPLKWLESLAARQGANPEEFITSADLDVPEADPDAVIDEPGYTDYDPFGSSKAARAEPPPPAPAPPVTTPARAAGPSEDSSIDPLKWLESLARRQGANPEEFVTEANLEVPEVAADTVIDEPGYTPYDAGFGAPAPRPPVQEPVPVFTSPSGFDEADLTASEAAAVLGLDTDQMAPVTPEAPAAAPVAQPLADPLSGGVDPLAWLESLARRQGAKDEELITAANLEVPEPEPGVVIDEPGYVDYSPFGMGAEMVEAEPAAPAARRPAPEPVPSAPEKPPSGGDTLAWLDQLAATQGVTVPETPVSHPLAGLSDEEIEEKAAAGELTAEQMEAWLGRQAESLAAHRVQAEFAAEPEEVAPATPVELPSWLQEAITLDEAAATPVAAPAAEPAPLMEEIEEPPLPTEMPAWLTEEVVAPAAAELAALPGELEPEEFEPAEALPSAPAAGVPVEPAYEDSWAAALEEEYAAMQTGGTEKEPEWYTSALQAEEAPAVSEAAMPELVEEEPVPVEQAELPDWLRVAAPAEAAGEEELPDWLTDTVHERPADFLAAKVEAEPVPPPVEIPDWLAEPAVEVTEVPDWLAEVAPERPPEPVAPPAAKPAPKPVPAAAPPPTVSVITTAEVPAGAAYDRFRDRLRQNPADHQTRLELARTLTGGEDFAACLGQYEALIATEALLRDVETDLKALVETRPNIPQARRVLGDAIMRQGRLQDALDMYRAALEQL